MTSQTVRAPLWLDADTTPSRKSRYSRRRTLEAIKREAIKREAIGMLEYATEGQIGLWSSAIGGDFHGYMIKQGGEVYFEPPTAAEAA